jgi:Phosphotransferase enzyme family
MNSLPRSCEARAKAALELWSPIVGEAANHAPLLPAVLMPMHMAVDSAVYGVTAAGRDAAEFFLKVYQLDMPAGIDLAATAAASRQAASLGLSPALLAEDAGHGALLYAMLPGPDWRMAMRDDFARPEFTAAALAAKRAWHGSARLAVSRSPFDTIRGYLQHMKVLAEPQVNAMHTLRLPQGFHTLSDWIGRIDQGLQAAGCESGPVHGENTVSNLMVGQGGEVRLVDFDRAVNADPHHDLGAICNEVCSFDDEVAQMVELYLGHPDSRVTARAQLYMLVDDFLWACWSLIAHYTSARSSTVEFYKYAQNRFLRARYGIERWDIDALLRRA